MRTRSLTEREHVVLRAFKELMDETGRPPVIRDIASKVGRKSATVYPQIRSLVKRGLLVQEGRHYAIRNYQPKRCALCGREHDGSK